MSFTYGQGATQQQNIIRLMVADTDPANPIFSDAEINNALYQESSQNLYNSSMAVPNAVSYQVPVQIYSVYRSAALLLRSLAANKSRLASVTQLLDVKLSPAEASRALRETAKEYMEQENDSGAFAIAEMVQDQFGARERVVKQIFRLYGGV